jgi:hypothetical protein
MNDFTLGLDLGQAQDYTAAAVVEQVRPERKRDPRATNPPHSPPEPPPKPKYYLRHVERFELDTPYPQQVRRVEELMQSAPLRERGCQLVVDQTGAGRPVVDLFREANLDPAGVTITGGDATGRDGRDYRVPKKDLVSTVQALLQTGRLKFAEGLPLAGVLTEELQKFRAKIDVSTGHASFEHWRERDHDDVVLALALACWHGENKRELPPKPKSHVFNRFG